MFFYQKTQKKSKNESKGKIEKEKLPLDFFF
jgi:hypothetical protein